MSAPRTVSVTKDQLIELILAALGSSHAGLKALRGVLASDPRLAVLDNAVDLQPVWAVLEAQPDFSREAATSALCYVKAQEGRLGVSMNLPAALRGLSAAERATQASYCRPEREHVARILAGHDLRAAQSANTEAAAAAAAAAPLAERFSRRQLIALGSGLVLAASLVIVVYSIGSSLDSSPKFKRIDAAEFAGDIPIGAARMSGTEVRASLVDTGWLRQPEDRRRRQLEQAIDRLSVRNVTTIIIEDENNRQRASAQVVGRRRQIQVRFY